MPIRLEYCWPYSIDWPQLSGAIRIDRAGAGCERCGEPQLTRVAHLGDGRWWDAGARCWRSERSKPMAVKNFGLALVKPPMWFSPARVLIMILEIALRPTSLRYVSHASRLGGGITLVRDTDEPLEPVLWQAVEELRTTAPERTLLADYDLDDPIDCDRGHIGQLLSNLRGNALMHGARNQPVRVSARTTEALLRFAVSNGGTPILAAAMERLFQPFFRGQVRCDRDGLRLHVARGHALCHPRQKIGRAAATAAVRSTWAPAAARKSSAADPPGRSGVQRALDGRRTAHHLENCR
ncbi:hypothetical protein FHS96_005539 [Sphingomonas zeicaulis]|uniref:sensor histidine kinase n=1 Tax=Sphingomonas zeicaulis TaxID=1632740 RepID=UPI003D243D6A